MSKWLPVNILLPSGQIIENIASNEEDRAAGMLLNSVYKDAKVLTDAERDDLVTVPDEDRHYGQKRKMTGPERAAAAQARNDVRQEAVDVSTRKTKRLALVDAILDLPVAASDTAILDAIRSIL